MAYFKKGGYFRPQSCICSVIYTPPNSDGMTGTGSLYGLEFPEGNWRTLLMTSYHVTPIKHTSEVTNIKLIFEDKTIGNINLTPDWVKMLWYSPGECGCPKSKNVTTTCTCLKLDIIIIELSTIGMKVLSRTKFSRLVQQEAKPQEGDPVSVFQYPGGEMKVGNGYIQAIDRDHNIIDYIVDSESGSSGSPLLNSDFRVLGIHCGAWLDPKIPSNLQTNAVKKATPIDVIFKAFIDELIRQSSGKTDNERFLEWINQIPKHELKLIGPGGYGKVYKAIEENKNPIALKIIEGFGGLDIYKKQVEELKKEYDVVAKLQIPRIIQLFAFVRDDQNARLILKMEYVDGGSLADKMKSNVPLDKALCLKYMAQLLEGVEALHGKEIYHGDIKPANILFTKDDDIKICDVGIAVHLQSASSTNSAHLRKDCYYMSPERITGTARSAPNDIWSIGATFVVMITGRTINYKDKFPKINMNIAQYSISIDDVPIKEYLVSLKDEADYRKKIISRTLCPLIERVTAQDLLEIVERCQNHLPTLGRTDTSPQLLDSK